MHELLTAIEQSIDIKAAAGSTFRAMLDRIGPKNGYEDHPMPMVLEPWPGGRWFRDLGNGAGHLWGHVQVYKPPTLLEICGPMFMSYPVASHLQLRVAEIPGGSRVTLTHRILGVMEEEHKVGVHEGWAEFLRGVQSLAK
jgi:hypothetical protein